MCLCCNILVVCRCLLLSRNLNEKIDGDCFVSSGKLVHALIVDGKKEI